MDREVDKFQRLIKESSPEDPAIVLTKLQALAIRREIDLLEKFWIRAVWELNQLRMKYEPEYFEVKEK